MRFERHGIQSHRWGADGFVTPIIGSLARPYTSIAIALLGHIITKYAIPAQDEAPADAVFILAAVHGPQRMPRVHRGLA
jgi:hypothetical protein